jgi:hypothetical protein
MTAPPNMRKSTDSQGQLELVRTLPLYVFPLLSKESCTPVLAGFTHDSVSIPMAQVPILKQMKGFSFFLSDPDSRLHIRKVTNLHICHL